MAMKPQIAMRACMARLPVSDSLNIISPECTGCLDCLAVCPVDGALEVRTLGRRRISPIAYDAVVVGLFLVGYVGARVGRSWSNEISDMEYVERIQELNTGAYAHPGR